MLSALPHIFNRLRDERRRTGDRRGKTPDQ
jgi:hypothetical protein